MAGVAVSKPKGIKRKIKLATKNLDELIGAFAAEGFFAGGIASEGYNGGYRDALQDILLLLNGISPCIRPEFWHKEKTNDIT